MWQLLQTFQEVRNDFIAAVCVACQPIFLPPNEMVIYGGETAREMFMIEKGKCLVNAYHYVITYLSWKLYYHL